MNDIATVTDTNDTVHTDLKKHGYTINWFTEYHGRIGEDIDIYVSSKRPGVLFIDRENGNRCRCEENCVGQVLDEYISSGRKDRNKFIKPTFYL